MAQVFKKDIIKSISKECGLSQEKTGHLLNIVLEAIENEVATGNSVVLTKFGTFSRERTKAKEVKLPGQTDLHTVPAGNRVRFRASPSMKRRLNT